MMQKVQSKVKKGPEQTNIGLAKWILSLPPGGSGHDCQSGSFGWRKVIPEDFYATWGHSLLVLTLLVTQASPSFLLHSVILETHAMLSSLLQTNSQSVLGEKSWHIGQTLPKHSQSSLWLNHSIVHHLTL